MNDHRRYQPCYRGKTNKDRRYDDGENNDFKRHYKKSNSYHHHSHSSSRHDDRLNHHHYRDPSHRYSNRNNYRYQYEYQQSMLKNSSSFSTKPPSLLSLPILNPVLTTNLANPLQPPLPAPLPPPPPPPSQPPPVVSERESWVRSVKKTKFNESVEQKTQYLETMLRLPQQQKLTISASRFDRMRFANDQSSTLLTTKAVSNSVNNNSMPAQDSVLPNNATFHLVSDIDVHDDIQAIQRTLFDRQLTSKFTNGEQSVNQETIAESSSNENIEPNDDQHETPSGFLIADCDEDVEAPPASPPLPTPPSPVTVTTTTTINKEPIRQISEEDNNKRRILLLNELDAAEAERKRISKRQKRLQQSLKQRKSSGKTSKNQCQQEKSVVIESEITPNEHEESPSDWIFEYQTESSDPVTQLKNEVRNSSLIISDEERTAKVNLILMKIKNQQSELKKLKQYVMSILDDQSTATTSKSTRTKSVLTQDLLIALFNQPTSTGCWFCSGKMYSEAATQYDLSTNE